MLLTVYNQPIHFQEIPLIFSRRDIKDVFFLKNNKTLVETYAHGRYSRFRTLHRELYDAHLNTALGSFLQVLKTSGDLNYLNFLNKYGDKSYCEFTINVRLTDKGVYCFAVGEEIKYVGRCTDSFKKRINQGYGKIHPKNCFIDGQATNCHLNSLINNHPDVRFGVHSMTDKSTAQIKKLEKQILASRTFEWNIQTR